MMHSAQYIVFGHARVGTIVVSVPNRLKDANSPRLAHAWHQEMGFGVFFDNLTGYYKKLVAHGVGGGGRHGRNRRGKHRQIGGRPPKPWPEPVFSSQSVHTTCVCSEQRSEIIGGDRRPANAYTGTKRWRRTRKRETGTADTRTQRRNWQQNGSVMTEVQ